MKKIILILLLLTTLKGFSCDCDDVNPILEFYSSEYVFEGKIISKVYTKDSLTYKVTFEVLKHYKKGNSPKTLEFELRAEEKYTGQWTSCDWHAEKDQNWLVYAYNYKGKLHFSGMCSNSKIIDYRPIGSREQKMLDNGNSFNIEDYIFENESGFNYCENVSDLNPVLAKGKIKNHKTQTTLLNIFVDSNGNLKSVIRYRELLTKKDSIFNLITEIADANRKPITEFEADAIELVSQVKKWEIKKHKKTGINVPYIRHIWISYNLKTNKWSYEL